MEEGDNVGKGIVRHPSTPAKVAKSSRSNLQKKHPNIIVVKEIQWYQFVQSVQLLCTTCSQFIVPNPENVPQNILSIQSSHLYILLRNRTVSGLCSLDDGSIPLASILYAVAVNAWRWSGRETTLACLFFTLVIDIFEIEGMNMAGDIPVSLLAFASCGRRTGSRPCVAGGKKES